MTNRKIWSLGQMLTIFSLLLPSGLAIAGAISKPDPRHGKELAEKLCTNCHLVGGAEQQYANTDVPSFREIGNATGQTAGAITAHIILPKHPMPQIPLTKSELADLASYILSLRDAPAR
jgi:mono/diheme cytochrome c family protein